jgi:hypothetical protein
LHDEFDFALLGRLLILGWPEFIIEMQGPFLPAEPHFRKSFRPERKLPSFARYARAEIIQQQIAVLLPRADKIESPVIRIRISGQNQNGTDRADVHGVPKQITPGQIAAIHLDFPLAYPISLQSAAQLFDMTPYRLRFLFRLIRFGVPFWRSHILCKQTRAGTFKEIAFAPGPTRQSDIKRVAFPVI